MTVRILCLALAMFAASRASATAAAFAGQPNIAPQDWHDTKCSRYRKAWAEVLAREGTQGLGKDFLARHEAFLVSNCTRRSDVCPRSPEELKLANIMVVRSMNFGAASTFVPFYCR